MIYDYQIICDYQVELRCDDHLPFKVGHSRKLVLF